MLHTQRRVLLAAVVLCGIGACRGGRAAPSPSAPAPIARDTIQEINDRFVREMLTRIAGQEGDSAGKVFKNVKQMGGVPARTFLRIMNGGYARALGVTCTHCHVEADF